MSIADFGGLIAGVVSLAIAICFGRLQTRIADKVLFISVARDVHDRYSQLYGGLHALPKEGLDQLTAEQLAAISAYVNLCAEEYLWKARGIVDSQVWEVWQDAIEEKFRTTVIGEAWEKLHCDDKYYEGFAKFIDDILSQR